MSHIVFPQNLHTNWSLACVFPKSQWANSNPASGPQGSTASLQVLFAWLPLSAHPTFLELHLLFQSILVLLPDSSF